jgi:hypothetical protein
MVSMAPITEIVQVLNQYANLLLVLVTLVFVWLSWRNLKALREASLRDRQAQHLREIKEEVVRPIAFWTGGTVLGRLTGKTPKLLTSSSSNTGSQSLRIIDTIDDPFRPGRRLNVEDDKEAWDPLSVWASTRTGRISSFLYGEARRFHFPNELGAFDVLLQEVRELARAITAFANECAERTPGCDTVPRFLSPADDSLPEYANPYELAAESVNGFLLGSRSPYLRRLPEGQYHLLNTGDNRTVARTTQEARLDLLEKWANGCFEEITERWKTSKLPARVRQVLADAERVGRNVEGLMYVQNLGVDCQLVSGQKEHWWQRLA